MAQRGPGALPVHGAPLFSLRGSTKSSPERKECAATHAHGHLGEAFIDWVDAGMTDDMVGEDILNEGGRPLEWLLSRLARCSDIMP